MEIKDLPPPCKYQPGGIVEVIKHNTDGTPLDENQTRYRVAIMLGYGTDGMIE